MRLLVVVALVSSLGPAAWAQEVEEAEESEEPEAPEAYGEDTGYIGKRKVRLEVDDCARAPDADSQATAQIASEHYQRGGVLYFQGDYEGAIHEFVSAACLYPAGKDFLFNIGQSYERLLEFERAVAYYERYVLATEDVAERKNVSARIEVLKGLPARVQVATVPDGATVSFTDEFGIKQSGGRVGDRPYEIVAGRYTVTVELAGYETVEQVLETEIGKPYSLFFPLQPKKGRLVINAEPVDARIFVDDKLVGFGRFEDFLPGGTYEVTVEAPDRLAETRLVEVVADRDTDVPVRLPPKPASGRTQLLIGSSIAGGALGSVALGVLEGESDTRAGLGFLGGVGVGFLGGYYGIPDDIEVGTSSYILTASLVGATEAGLVTSIFEEGADITGPVAVGGMAAGAVFASVTAGRFQLSAGDAAMLNTGALWGGIAGGLFSAIFEFEPKVSEGLVLGGLNLGVVTGVLLGRQVEYSRRHVALIDLAGLAGMGLAVATQSVIDSARDDGDMTDADGGAERTAHFALAGMAGGLALGAYFTRNVDVPKVKTLTPNLTTTSDPDGGKTTLFRLGGTF